MSRHEDLRRVVMSPEAYSSNLVDKLFSREESGPQVVPLGSHGPKPVDVLIRLPMHEAAREAMIAKPPGRSDIRRERA